MTDDPTYFIVYTLAILAFGILVGSVATIIAANEWRIWRSMRHGGEIDLTGAKRK